MWTFLCVEYPVMIVLPNLCNMFKGHLVQLILRVTNRPGGAGGLDKDAITHQVLGRI